MRAKQELSKVATKTRQKAETAAKRKLAGGDKSLLGKKWQLWVAPAQKKIVAEDAPSCHMMIQNLGPAMVEVRCPRQEPNILLKGKFTIMPARGRITVENLEEESATVQVEFMPKA